MVLTERWLEPSEVGLLDEVLDSKGWSRINPNGSMVYAVFDNDKLVGFFVLQGFPFLGPLHVDQEYRTQPVLFKLIANMRTMLKDIHAKGCLITAENPSVASLCESIGLERITYPVFIKKDSF